MKKITKFMLKADFKLAKSFAKGLYNDLMDGKVTKSTKIKYNILKTSAKLTNKYISKKYGL